MKSGNLRRDISRYALAGALAACGGGGGDTPPPPPVAVSVAPSTGTVKVDQTAQFSASVTGSNNTAVDWSVAGPGCTGTGCGIVNAAGLYSAPSIVPVPPTVTVTATAQADATKSAAANVTLGSDVAVMVWPPLARTTIGQSRQFLRTLTGNANAAVTWSLSGAGCGGASCGTVDTNGRYVAPAVTPSPPTVFIRATSVVDPGKSATAEIAVQATNNRTLSGTYAYMHRGVLNNFDGVQAGISTANGAGVLTSGVQDSVVSNAVGGNRVNLGFSGTYDIGIDNRGLLSFALAGGGTVDWRSSHTASGDRAFMQPFYNVAARGNAVLHRTDPSAFNNSGVNGDYVFQWNGADVNGNRFANIGRFTANGAGVISDGLIDGNDGMTLTANVAFTGSYNVSQTGRGTMQLTVPGQGTFSFAVYVVSADTLIVVSTDTLAAGTPIRIGYALRQSGGPFANASLLGNYVFDLAGRRSSSAALATTGMIASDGAGAITGMLDRNDNYVMSVAQPFTASYTVAANGRGTLTSSALPTTIFYLTGTGKAVLMEGPGSSVQSGTMERQLAAPYATANLVGQFAQGSSPPARLVSLSVTGQVFYDGPAPYSYTIDIASPCALDANGTSNATIAVTSAGRMIVSAGGVQHAAGCLITPGRYVLTLQRASGDPASCDEVVHHYTAEQ